jgi:hypothetical protein
MGPILPKPATATLRTWDIGILPDEVERAETASPLYTIGLGRFGDVGELPGPGRRRLKPSKWWMRRRRRKGWSVRVVSAAGGISLLRSRFPSLELRDLSPILDELRLVKSPREISLIGEA